MSEEIIPGNEDAGELSRLLRQYGCGPIQFAGTNDALFERHLIFDNVVDPATAHPRERFEAIARSVRDVLSQRWLHTERSYQLENSKRIYYLSMEFLLGRSLANNLTNLLLDSFARQAAARKHLEWLELLDREPDAGLGNGGLGRLAACFLDSMATMQLPAMGYGCDMNMASSSKRSGMAGSRNSRTTGCSMLTPGRLPVTTRRWKSN